MGRSRYRIAATQSWRWWGLEWRHAYCWWPMRREQPSMISRVSGHRILRSFDSTYIFNKQRERWTFRGIRCPGEHRLNMKVLSMGLLTYWFIVKSRGAVPNKKDKSKRLANVYSPLVIDFPLLVSKLKLLRPVWYCTLLMSFHPLFSNSKTYLICHTIWIQIPPRELDIFLTFSVIKFSSCSYVQYDAHNR